MKAILLIFLIFICIGVASASTVTIVHPHTGNVYEYGCSNKIITLKNYADAKDITYSQLLTFLKADKTDEKRYTNSYCCADFAETLHNVAEKAGIRCAWIGIDFKGNGYGHAINEFTTTDKGNVFIDDTGSNPASKYDDAIVDLKVGEKLTGTYLFKKGSYSMGVVKTIETTW